MKVELRKAWCPTVAGTPTATLQMAVQVYAESVLPPCFSPSCKYTSRMSHTAVGGLGNSLVLLCCGIQFLCLGFCICQGIGST